MSYIEYVKLLNRCWNHAYEATTPAKHNYWLKQRARLREALQRQGWKI